MTELEQALKADNAALRARLAETEGKVGVLVEALNSVKSRTGLGADHVICHECRDSSNEAFAAIAAAGGEA